MLITAAEAAEILGMTLQSVSDATSRGRLPRHAPGHVRRAYDRDEIEANSLARSSAFSTISFPTGGSAPPDQS